ncbi:MAG TPA: transaldolase, partial [Armatimonadota bacterium]|nr:transaldolase [Armatimonadota bacterium]
ALRMEHACASSVPVHDNPGITLGTVMGELALRGINKVTFIMPPQLGALGLWLEQLLAESTGKEGTGLLPVAGETLGSPADYGNDRLFIYFRLQNAIDDHQEQGVLALQTIGHPLVMINMDDLFDIGQEFFRWEMATATAGAMLGINAFNQPNVQESKDNTNHLLEQFAKTGHLPDEKPVVSEPPLSLYAKKRAETFTGTVQQFLDQGKAGEYLAILAYVTENGENDQLLQNLQSSLRDYSHLATTMGYGPRYLHSTGQFHKGGPKIGMFLLLTADTRKDIAIPGQPYSFRTLRQAQALGDFQALRQHGQQVLRLDLGQDAHAGLTALQQIIQNIVAESRRGKAA